MEWKQTHANTFTANRDIRQSRIREFGNSTLLLEVERNITHVRLDLTKVEGNIVGAVVVDDIIRAELEVVLGLHADDVGEQILSRQSEVLDDKIKGVICVLDAGDGNVSDLERS